MKKLWRPVIIVSLALVILGLALLGVSLLTGGSIANIRAHGTAPDYFGSVLDHIRALLPWLNF